MPSPHSPDWRSLHALCSACAYIISFNLHNHPQEVSPIIINTVKMKILKLKRIRRLPRYTYSKTQHLVGENQDNPKSDWGCWFLSSERDHPRITVRSNIFSPPTPQKRLKKILVPALRGLAGSRGRNGLRACRKKKCSWFSYVLIFSPNEKFAMVREAPNKQYCD